MRKAQITMEALLLYGAAILVVLLAVAALIYFGILDLGSLLPEKCNFENTALFRCEEYKVTTSTVEISLANKGSKTITISSAEFVPKDSGMGSPCSDAQSVTIVPGGVGLVTIDGCSINADMEGKRISGQVSITHTLADGGLIDQTTVGDLSVTVTS